MKHLDLYRWHIRDAVTGKVCLTSHLMGRSDAMVRHPEAQPYLPSHEVRVALDGPDLFENTSDCSQGAPAWVDGRGEEVMTDWIDSRERKPTTDMPIIVWREPEPGKPEGIVYAEWRESSANWVDTRNGGERLPFRFWQPAPVSPYPPTISTRAPQPASPGRPQFWQVWQEGYASTGGPTGASFCGTFPGTTFDDACAAWAATLPAGSRSSFNRQELAFWGCRLYDNETDARKKFG